MQDSEAVGGLMLSTRETFSRAFVDFGLVVGEGETVNKACDNLTANAQGVGADGVIGLRIVSRQNPPGIIMYGTLMRWVPAQKGRSLP
jgi:uncharacterized protein YbjQ (UPF0145 family)